MPLSRGEMYTRMLEDHDDNPKIWIVAAKSEYEGNRISNSANKGRELFQRALRRHPSCVEIYMAYFEMELFNARKLRNQIEEYAEEKVLKRKRTKFSKTKSEIDEDYENILSGSLAIKVAEGAFKDVSKDEIPSLAQGFLTVTRPFVFAKDVRNWLVGKLVAEFPDCEITHDVVAQRFLDEDAYEENRVPHLNMRIENCYKSFEESLRTINTEDMWDKYLYAVADLEEIYKNRSWEHSKKYFQVTCRAFEATGKFGETLVSLLRSKKEFQMALDILDHVIEQKLTEGRNCRVIAKLLKNKLGLLELYLRYFKSRASAVRPLLPVSLLRSKKEFQLALDIFDHVIEQKLTEGRNCRVIAKLLRDKLGLLELYLRYFKSRASGENPVGEKNSRPENPLGPIIPSAVKSCGVRKSRRFPQEKVWIEYHETAKKTKADDPTLESIKSRASMSLKGSELDAFNDFFVKNSPCDENEVEASDMMINVDAMLAD
ncbi:unnamed protein product [Notodromas monacha]|uniref:Uncharacterized protein n=1 Tax=Notodromas monacha TaxID=399045 RepID=A0A7R9GBM6_9CRUS|nr:unnamed protein product [Notodromas monacha]CAG0916682.1 unnamed protein product [Notodromas monacha]